MKCCACIIDGHTMLEHKQLKTYLHILQNEHLKSLVSNSTKTSGQMKKIIDVQIVANAIKRSKIPHSLKLV